MACRVFIYPHRQAYQIPEHRDVKEMKRWLRTTPQDLSFVEVWDDLREVLGQRETFTPFTTDSDYKVSLVDEPRGLRVATNTKRWLVPCDDLLDLWHQLRSFGFVSSRSAPSELERDLSYVAPVFAALQYVQPVRIAGDYVGDEDFDRSAEYALQFIPRVGEALSANMSETPTV